MRTRRRALLAGSIGAIGLLIAGVWIERRALVGTLVDRRLAAAGVPGRYRLTTFGPSLQVIEDVRLGEAARPDFTARRVALHWRYTLGLPTLAAIEVTGGRLRASWRDGRLSLGAIDRLLPRSGGGGAVLPDLAATLRDTRIDLTTPVGTIAAAIEGTGNLARDFRAAVRVDAPRLAFAGCPVGRTGARLDVRTAGGGVRLRGPVAVEGVSCGSLRLGPGGVATDLRLSPGFDRVAGNVALAGFAGRSGAVRFGRVRGSIGVAGGAAIEGRGTIAVADIHAGVASAGTASFVGRFRHDGRATALDGRIALRAVAARSIRAPVRGATSAMRGTPLGPIADRIGAAVAALATGSDLDAPLALTIAERATLRIDRGTIGVPGRAPATVSIDLERTADRWRATGEIAGGDLPHVTARASKGAGTAINATVTLAPYRAGTALLALTPIRLTTEGQRTRFSTSVTLDGPLGSGRIEGLSVPLAGSIDGSGALALGSGCATVAFQSVRLPGMTLDPAQVAMCGSPIVAKTGGGPLRIAAETRDLVLTGRSGTAPLSLRAAALRLTEAGFTGSAIGARIGAPDDPTRLDIASLKGSLAPGGLGGRFTEAAGSIGHVPLALSGATGTWRLAGGALHLGGALHVADRAEVARFLPLVADDVTLDLIDGRIAGAGTLHALGRTGKIAAVALRHDLASGGGGATLDVPGIAFARGGLQPEMLTPLTLGVVANVAGSVRGSGRIDWTPAGTTSSGTFETERLDLAAAFGPVTGVAGKIRFTDLLGLVTAPHQEARIASINPGVAVEDGVAHYQLIGDNRVQVEDARWPFAGGTLALDPTTLDFGQAAERRLTFRVAGLDAAAFIQQLDFPNISATGTFDGRLPMVFDQAGGRIENGALTARGPGTLAYVGELSNAQLGTMGKLAFDALKAIRYSGLDITLGGSLDGEIVTRVRFDGVRQATGDKGIVARMIRNLPFRFNIRIQAPFRGLVGSARSYANPALLLQSARPPVPVQPADSAIVR